MNETAETAARLKAWASSGSPINTATFPGARHGLWEFEETPVGTRLLTRQPKGYFKMMVEYVRNGRFLGAYGADPITNPERGKETGRKVQSGDRTHWQSQETRD